MMVKWRVWNALMAVHVQYDKIKLLKEYSADIIR